LLEIIPGCEGEGKMFLPPEEITAGESFLTIIGISPFDTVATLKQGEFLDKDAYSHLWDSGLGSL